MSSSRRAINGESDASVQHEEQAATAQTAAGPVRRVTSAIGSTRCRRVALASSLSCSLTTLSLALTGLCVLCQPARVHCYTPTPSVPALGRNTLRASRWWTTPGQLSPAGCAARGTRPLPLMHSDRPCPAQHLRPVCHRYWVRVRPQLPHAVNPTHVRFDCSTAVDPQVLVCALSVLSGANAYLLYKLRANGDYSTPTQSSLAPSSDTWLESIRHDRTASHYGLSAIP